METAPLLLEELNLEHSTKDGCTWRSLCSDLHAAEPADRKCALRAGCMRIRKELKTQDEPKSMAEFADRVGKVSKTSLSLKNVSSNVLLSPQEGSQALSPEIVREMYSRERAMIDWVLDPIRTGITQCKW